MHPLLRLFIATACYLFTPLTHAAGLHTLGQTISDSVITTKITTKYTKNTHLSPLKLSVTTHQGIVTLTGHVKDKTAFVEALRLAINTKGVKSVEADNLDIQRVNTAFTDEYITTKIETAVLKAKVLDDESIPLVGITASTTNGIVTLTGDVKHPQSIDVILKRAYAVRGVKRIISNLHCNKPCNPI